jgi:hypothetical protein
VIVHDVRDPKLFVQFSEKVHHDGGPFPCVLTLKASNYFRGASTEVIIVLRDWCREQLDGNSWGTPSLMSLAFTPEALLLFKLRWW